MAEIKAVIFDLYGTLLHIPGGSVAYSRLFDALGITSPAELKQAKVLALTQNTDIAGLAKRLRPDIDFDVRPYVETVKQEIQSVALFTETRRVIGELRQRNIALG